MRPRSGRSKFSGLLPVAISGSFPQYVPPIRVRFFARLQGMAGTGNILPHPGAGEADIGANSRLANKLAPIGTGRHAMPETAAPPSHGPVHRLPVHRLPVHRLPVHRLIGDLAARRLSPVDLVEDCLTRI